MSIPVDEPPERDLADPVPRLVCVDVVAEPGHLQLPDHVRRVLAVRVDGRDELERVLQDGAPRDQAITDYGFDGANRIYTGWSIELGPPPPGSYSNGPLAPVHADPLLLQSGEHFTLLKHSLLMVMLQNCQFPCHEMHILTYEGRSYE